MRNRNLTSIANILMGLPLVDGNAANMKFSPCILSCEGFEIFLFLLTFKGIFDIIKVNGNEYCDNKKMETKIFDLKQKEEAERGLRCAAETIRGGGLVVFPTETVYGLGANALDANAAKKIFLAKGRPSDNPLIVHVNNREMIDRVAETISADAEKVMNFFMPGPITLILPKSEHIPMDVTAGLDSVAVRMPRLDVARELIRLSGVPIAAPSANLSGKPSPTEPSHVLEDMKGRADVILLGDACEIGVESTVLDIHEKPYKILRPGAVTYEDLGQIIDLEKTTIISLEGKAPRSPGMKYRHYKPNAAVIALRGSDSDVLRCINSLAQKDSCKTAALVFEPFMTYMQTDKVFSLGRKEVPTDAAKVLFSAFRSCDTLGIGKIYVMTTTHSGIGDAFLNRLYKAADQIIDATSEGCKS
jgi:L-threonylcarbamoyladenylate synthase